MTASQGTPVTPFSSSQQNHDDLEEDGDEDAPLAAGAPSASSNEPEGEESLQDLADRLRQRSEAAEIAAEETEAQALASQPERGVAETDPLLIDEKGRRWGAEGWTGGDEGKERVRRDEDQLRRDEAAAEILKEVQDGDEGAGGAATEPNLQDWGSVPPHVLKQVGKGDDWSTLPSVLVV